jgi:hypothetical protein
MKVCGILAAIAPIALIETDQTIGSAFYGRCSSIGLVVPEFLTLDFLNRVRKQLVGVRWNWAFCP